MCTSAYENILSLNFFVRLYSYLYTDNAIFMVLIFTCFFVFAYIFALYNYFCSYFLLNERRLIVNRRNFSILNKYLIFYNKSERVDHFSVFFTKTNQSGLKLLLEA
jgi:hypothetical protein